MLWKFVPAAEVLSCGQSGKCLVTSYITIVSYIQNLIKQCSVKVNALCIQHCYYYASGGRRLYCLLVCGPSGDFENFYMH